MAFAGVTNSSGTYSYLKTNASGNYYWTMSPRDISGDGYPCVWYVNSTGSLHFDGNYHVVNGVLGSVRPSIVLASNVTISSGDGTQTNPYAIS